MGLYAVHTQECIERAAEKTGHRLEYATRLGRTSTSRLANGTILVPRAAELDTNVMQVCGEQQSRTDSRHKSCPLSLHPSHVLFSLLARYTHVMQSLPAAMQFEVLEEIQLAERSRRRDVLVTSGHTMDSFSHTQVSKSKQASKAKQIRRP